ncbi:MAG: prepilin-type N-terminal cleavage/methylation protein [Solimicrobium sp.]|nr:prepilin-type N-terminal cleavage/methylation protein [Solimicrobium sp.]
MHSKNRGFTLIELLIAISILAIVAVLGWRGLDSIVRSREVLTAELAQTRNLQLTFAQLQSDCSQNVNPLSYPTMTDGRSSWIEPQQLILIRHEYLDDQAPAMQVVVYRLQNSNLVRFESDPTRDFALLNQFLEQAKNPSSDQIAVIMQKNVQNVEFTGYPENLSGPNLTPNSANTPFADNKKKDDNSKNNDDSKKPLANNNSIDKSEENDTKKPNQANVATGLQVSLQLQNHDKRITKIFMLGGA